MASGCLILVDGWNHFIAAKTCFGYPVATKFPVDRLAKHLAAEIGADSVQAAVVVMALPDRNRPAEEAEFHAWRKKLNKLRNYGVRHEHARFSYHDLRCSACKHTLSRQIICPSCGTPNQVAGRRKEKGADVRLSTLALNGAWAQDYSSLVLLSQDSDFGPMIQQVKNVHRQQGRKYELYSAFPVCAAEDHEHRGVPGTQQIHLSARVYGTLTQQAYVSCYAP